MGRSGDMIVCIHAGELVVFVQSVVNDCIGRFMGCVFVVWGQYKGW